MLPTFNVPSTPIMLLQSSWKVQLDPVLTNPMNDVSILTNVSLRNGVTVVNHLLGHMMNGWFITDINGAATIYRSAGLNDKTLTLTSNAAVTVNIGVF